MLRLLGQALLLPIFLFTSSPLSEQPTPATGSGTNKLPFFTDVTQQAGVAYKITCGDEVTEYQIDVNGQGAAFFDYDNDGFQDIYLVNGSSRKSIKSGKLPHDYLLHNNGDGTFTDVTEKAHLGDTEWSSGVAVGDYDNDGYLDLYVTNFGPNKLYHNNGDGTFTEVGEKAGVADPKWGFPKWSMGAAFGDIDNDGYLDLYVCNYVDFNYQEDRPPPSINSPCKMKGVPIACPPEKYKGVQDLLYRNNGDGTFTDVSEKAGITRKDPGRGFAVVFSDFDNDGDQDIYVANDVGPNFYYVNDGKGHFSDQSLVSGTSIDEFGNAHGSMGLGIGDVNGDGLPDIFVTTFIDQPKTLYINQGSNMFLDQTTSFGLGTLALHSSAWGTKLLDFDNDGWLDIFFTTSHTMEQLEKEYPLDPYAEPNYLCRNEQGKGFKDVSEAAGLRKIRNKVGRGIAFGDYDNDGDIDVLVINKNDIPYLLRNDGGNSNNWINIRTEGVKSNRCGIGAKVLVTAGGSTRLYEVRGSDSYLSSNDLRVNAGLGSLKEADIVIRWPSGLVDKQSGVKVNQFYLAREGEPLRPDPRISNGKVTR
ncbi:MAG TPA: CRTAC1 family protein [Terriglobia bacterium]|nr:CRTAC1 family protein [Terriglobia bacterium]